MSTTEPNALYKWAKRKPVCEKCGEVVSRPTMVREQLRGDCAEHGRVNAKWVGR